MIILNLSARTHLPKYSHNKCSNYKETKNENPKKLKYVNYAHKLKIEYINILFKFKNNKMIIFLNCIYILTTAQDIRPPTLVRHALYIRRRVAPVARNPTNIIINVRAPIPAAINTKTVFIVSSL
jgi:hypothetical protein